MKKISKNTNRYFLGTQEIAGIMHRVNIGLRETGYRSDFYCLYEHPFFRYDDMPKAMKAYRVHTDRIRRTKNNILKKILYLIQAVDMIYILIYSLFHYDNYLYIFGHGIFVYNYYLKRVEELEFKILKLAHKKMIMWNCGTDTRAPYTQTVLYDNNYEKMYQDTLKKKKRIKMIEKYMISIDNPASVHFHEKPYIIYQSVGIPVESIERKKNREKDKHIIIMHAPSNKKMKGTEKIQAIINELKKEFDYINYVEVTGVEHNKVMEFLENADIVVDQMFTDTPMAGLATEAAALGIPAVSSGYFAYDIEKCIVTPLAPTTYCKPEEIKEKIRELILNDDYRKKMGEIVYRYICDYLTINKVASRFIQIFENNIPDEWWCKFENCNYIWGFGTEQSEICKGIKWMIDNYGVESLQLEDKPWLRDKYLKLYNSI